MKSPIKPTAYPKFFATMRKATDALGLVTKEAQDAYYKRVLSEEAHCTSVKSLASQTAFDACLKRFAADAGDYQGAIDYETEKLKRTAYVVKVMAVQIMQFNDLGPSNARNYFERVLAQSRLPVGFHSDGSAFWMDMSQRSLLVVMQMLDTHLRRLKRQYFPTFPLSFSDRIAYRRDGGILMREDCPKHYYANLSFSVKLRG